MHLCFFYTKALIPRSAKEISNRLRISHSDDYCILLYIFPNTNFQKFQGFFRQDFEGISREFRGFFKGNFQEIPRHIIQKFRGFFRQDFEEISRDFQRKFSRNFEAKNPKISRGFQMKN